METGPDGQGAAGRLRASDADRERAVVLLQAAFVDGLLTRHEFGDRVGGALTARTYADLAALTAGIPAAPPPTPQRAAEPARRRPRPSRRMVTGGCTLVTGAVMIADAALTGSAAGPTANLFYLLFIVAFMTAFISWLCAVSAHRGDAATDQLAASRLPQPLTDHTSTTNATLRTPRDTGGQFPAPVGRRSAASRTITEDPGCQGRVWK